MIPITSQIGTNPTFCGIAMDGKDIVGDVVGTKVVTEVCTVPEGWMVLALPAITAATGMKRSETAHNNIRKWLIWTFINFNLEGHSYISISSIELRSV